MGYLGHFQLEKNSHGLTGYFFQAKMTFIWILESENRRSFTEFWRGTRSMEDGKRNNLLIIHVSAPTIVPPNTFVTNFPQRMLRKR